MIPVREFSTAEEVRANAVRVSRVAAKRDGRLSSQVIDMSQFLIPERKPVNTVQIEKRPLPIRQFWSQFSTTPVQMITRAAPTVKFIVRCAAFYFNVDENNILAQRRTKDVVIPRHMTTWACRKVTTLSLPSIGKALGNRDHTTILNAVRRVDAICASDPVFAEFSSGFVSYINHQWHWRGE